MLIRLLDTIARLNYFGIEIASKMFGHRAHASPHSEAMPLAQPARKRLGFTHSRGGLLGLTGEVFFGPESLHFYSLYLPRF
jgi:hypothetical protein